MVMPTATSPRNDPSHALLHNFHVNVKAFGAKGDGVTDDTTAIQAALDATVAAQTTLYVPVGIYKLTAALTIASADSSKPGWSIVGVSRRGSILKQFTNNTPILQINGENHANFRVANLGFDWNTAQTGNTNAIAITFSAAGTGVGIHSFELERLYFANGYRGIAQLPGATNLPVWGYHIHDLLFDTSWRGSAITLNANTGGQSTGLIQHVYVYANNIAAAESVFSFTGAHQLSLVDLEINNATLTAAEILLNTCNSPQVRNCKTEGGTIGSGFAFGGLLTLSGCNQAIVDGWEVDTKTLNVGGGNHAHAIRVIDNSDASIRGVNVQNITLTTGTFNALAATSADFCEFSNYALGASINALFAEAATENRVILIRPTAFELGANYALWAKSSVEIDGALNHDGTMVGFYGAAPIVQGASVADATGGATIDVEARAAINALISRIEALGLIATV